MPNNWFINAEKLESVKAAWEDGKSELLPPVLVTEIEGELSLIDGHARTYAAYETGATHIKARMMELEEIPGSKALYRHIHKEGPKIGVNKISDLSNRIVEPDKHEELWVGYCKQWLKENEG